MKYKEIAKNEEINAYLKKGDANLGQLGFTDHSQAHCVQVAHQAGKIPPRSSSRTRQTSGEARCGRRSRRPLTFTTGLITR